MNQRFESPDSSNIASAAYDFDSLILSVDFRLNHLDANIVRTYEYTGLPAELWEAFREAKSKGQFFAKEIRPKFKGVKKEQDGTTT